MLSKKLNISHYCISYNKMHIIYFLLRFTFHVTNHLISKSKIFIFLYTFLLFIQVYFIMLLIIDFDDDIILIYS